MRGCPIPKIIYARCTRESRVAAPTNMLAKLRFKMRCCLGVFRNRRTFARITSYNVCYTKLLRLLSMGTHQSKLYRSSKKEWIEGAEGFYWSNNNTKDEAIRLETIADLDGRPSAASAYPRSPRRCSRRRRRSRSASCAPRRSCSRRNNFV